MITGDTMDQFLQDLKLKSGNYPDLMEQFSVCYANILDKTMKVMDDGTVHIITGDIPAMWLRDSAAQVRPFLYMAKKDERVKNIIAGLVKRQFFYLCIDPYANAFNDSRSGACWDKDDLAHSPWVWERKFEIDSLCYPVQLAYLLWKNTGCVSQFDENFSKGIKEIIKVFRCEQNHEENSEYRFKRQGSYAADTLSRDGKGSLTRPNIGLIWSGFRPSDDACTYGYLIPSNMFAVVVLGYLEEIAEKILDNQSIKEEVQGLRYDVSQAIEKYGRTKTEEFGTVYAYEVDGYGMYCLMDDANVPSLLSVPYIGYPADEEIMGNTRRMILSEANPYFYKGKIASGIGSPHTPAGYIWPIALAMQGLTSSSEEEKIKILKTLAATTGGTHMMHEGFHAEDASKYTREWFAWANAMYAELFLDWSLLSQQKNKQI